MNKDSKFVERYALLLFLILTPLLSLAIPMWLPLGAEVVPLIMVLVPAVFALVLTALTDGRKGVSALLKKLVRWRVNLKWYAVALGLALGVRLAVSLLAVALGWIPGIAMSPWGPPQFVIIGVFILIGAVTEELGWRGYALPKLLNTFPALFSALIIGVVWGVIHLGLILPGQMNAGTDWLATVLYIVGLSVMLTWFYVQARGSLVIPILFHAGQSYFVFLNGGVTSTQQLVLLTVTFTALVIVIVLRSGVDLLKSSAVQTTVMSVGMAKR